MCICINCFYLKTCSTYKFIEEKHNLRTAFQLSEEKIFPKQTIIKTEINVSPTKEVWKDWDVSECTNFLESPGNWFLKDNANAVK